MSYVRRRGQWPIVDMSRSGIDKKEWKAIMSGSDLTKMDWKEQAKHIPTDYRINKAINPPYKFYWNRNDNAEISNWIHNYGYSLVTEIDGYWPEGIPPDSKGCFVRGDLILMKVPLEDWILRRKDELKRAGVGRKVNTQQHQNLCKHLGAEVDEDEINAAIGV